MPIKHDDGLDWGSQHAESVTLLTFDGMAIPRRSDLGYSICDSPVLVSNLDQTHSSFSSVPSSLDDIGLTASDRVFFRCTNDDGFCADCSKSVYMRSRVQFYNVSFR